MGLITLQGTPAAMTPAGMSWVTTLPAPMTEPAPMVTPPQTVAFAPIQTFSSSVMGAEVPTPWLRCSGSTAWPEQARQTPGAINAGVAVLDRPDADGHVGDLYSLGSVYRIFQADARHPPSV